MNNYLYANLTNGKVAKGQGGGTPIFTVGENNATQIYFLDFIKPGNYNASFPPLGDPYTYSPSPIYKSSSSIEVRVGPRINEVLISQPTWFDLPTNIDADFSLVVDKTIGQGLRSGILLSGSISLSQAPLYGSMTCGIKTTFTLDGYPEKTYGITFTLPYYFSTYEVSQLSDAFCSFLGKSENRIALERFSEFKSVYQTSDTSYAFYQSFNSWVPEAIAGEQTSSFSSTFTAAPGNYSNLDFSGPEWASYMGNDDEKEIWIDVLLDNKIVSQGIAILRNKLSL